MILDEEDKQMQCERDDGGNKHLQLGSGAGIEVQVCSGLTKGTNLIDGTREKEETIKKNGNTWKRFKKETEKRKALAVINDNTCLTEYFCKRKFMLGDEDGKIRRQLRIDLQERQVGK
ncbi:hypothetical protein ACH5RR_000278 [Cinchona calisaya]|uniref:Uncharacterized protein n=1 Tax=Cinchona calisaya TaxID=153742 RepID=A0ABD3B070_9GENT